MALAIARERGLIHPTDFLANARFAASDYPADITDEIREELKDCHPSMFIGDKLSMNMFKVKFRYDTMRGNAKEGMKYLLMNDTEGLSEYEATIMVESTFERWVSSFNVAYPYKSLLNAEILNVEPFCRAMIALG